MENSLATFVVKHYYYFHRKPLKTLVLGLETADFYLLSLGGDFFRCGQSVDTVVRLLWILHEVIKDFIFSLSLRQ